MGCFNSSTTSAPPTASELADLPAMNSAVASMGVPCKLCNNLSLQALNRGAHHASCCWELEESADRGCGFCSQIVKAIQRATPSPPAESAFSRALQEAGREEGTWMLWNGRVDTEVVVASRCACKGETVDYYGMLHIYVEPNSPFAPLIMGREVFPSADCEGAFDLMEHWMKACLGNHDNIPNEETRLCEDFKEMFPVGKPLSAAALAGPERERMPKLPTRVLDVGPSDGSEQPVLFESGDESYALYMTLSHCWGSSKPLVTTTTTLAERTSGILIETLPKTFRDAVLLTRRFGFRYLWIDSLCILQDSTTDWQHEAALMGQYYRNSFLTISAAGSHGSEEGCFIPRNWNDIFPPAKISLKLTAKATVPCDVYIAQSIGQVPFSSPEAADSRAWILQEMALSPRVLLFGEKMMGWLCNTLHRTERGDTIVHDKSRHYVMAPRLPHQLRYAVDYEETDIQWMMSSRWIRSESSTWWAKMVQDYSTRKLTVESDKLPALSGCARAIAALNKDEYLAGLWSKTAINDLLWQSVDSPRAVRPKKYRGPSWSWVSLDAEVKCYITSTYDGRNNKLIRNLTVQTDFVSADTFGQVKSMILFLEGSPSRVEVHEQAQADGKPSAGNKLFNLKPVDPQCTCPECTRQSEELQSVISDHQPPDPQASQPSSGVFTGLGESQVYASQNETTIGFTGLVGSGMRNAGPQYTSTNLGLTQTTELMRKTLFQDAAEVSAGKATFDVESEANMETPGDIWCLPVNPQFGLLLIADGRFLEGDEGEDKVEIQAFKRLGLVKLNLNWFPQHELRKIALL